MTDFDQVDYLPPSDEALESATNRSLMYLLQIVPQDALEQARIGRINSGPTGINVIPTLGAMLLVATKKHLISSGAVDRELDWRSFVAEHPELQ